MGTSYWLAEAREPLAAPDRARDGRRGRRRRRCHGLLLCADARRARRCASGSRGARDRGRRERPQRRLRSARRRAALRRGARALGADRREALWQLTERALDRLAGARGRRLPARRQPSARRGRRASARRSRASSTLCAATASPSSGSTRCRPPLDRLFGGAILHPGDGSIHPARWVRRLAAARRRGRRRDRRGTPASTRDELDARRGRHRRRRAHGAARARSSPAVVAPVRGQMLVDRAARRSSSTRARTTRAQGYDYWQQLPDGRLVVGGKRDASFETEQTAVEETTPAVQERARRARRRAARASCRGSRTAGPGSGARRPTGCRSSGRFRGATASGSRAATRATATCSASPAATSSRARSSASSRRSSSCSTRAPVLARARARGRSQAARALERRDRDREILDREARSSRRP